MALELAAANLMVAAADCERSLGWMELGLLLACAVEYVTWSSNV